MESLGYALLHLLKGDNFFWFKESETKNEDFLTQEAHANYYKAKEAFILKPGTDEWPVIVLSEYL